MKWIVFAVALAAILPTANLLRRNPNYTSVAWIAVGFLPFAYNPHIALVDWAGWPGYVKGLLITGLDLLGLVFFINLPKPRRPAPYKLVMGFYFVAVVISIIQAQIAMAAVFYAWQLLKVYFLYIVVRRASSDERVVKAILTGMAIALCLEAGLAGWQRLAQGVLRAEGTFGDKNLLGLASEFAMFTPFALLMAGKRGWQTIVAPLAGAIIAVLTASRAAVGFGAIGFVLVFLVSALGNWTPKKAKILFAGFIFVALLTPFAWQSFEQRFSDGSAQSGSEADERAMFNEAAASMLSDHPFGIGANNYVVVANSGGYSERAGVPWSSAVAIVHNVYWLTAAEVGYFGLITFSLLWFRITFTAFKCSWQHKQDPRADVLLGLSMTLLVVGLHNAYEWVFLVYNVQYLFAITVGLAAGLSDQLGQRHASNYLTTSGN